MRLEHGHAHNHGDAAESAVAGERTMVAGRAVRIGVGGPVGSGKSTLIAALCRLLGGRFSLAVVTNDIYTTEDADFLKRVGVLPEERIAAVQTGCCPHTAIRDDVSANLQAVEELETNIEGLEVVLVESGGDNLTAVFSPALADRQLFVIDVAGGDDIPRKGGPGILRSDLLVIAKTDLAPHVGVDAGAMKAEALERREGRPVELISLAGGLGEDGPGNGPGARPVADWLTAEIGALRGAPALAGEGTTR